MFFFNFLLGSHRFSPFFDMSLRAKRSNPAHQEITSGFGLERVPISPKND
jgi:hypothetical protein